MPESAAQLKRIHDKLQQLLKEYAAVQKQNSKLKEELIVTQETLSTHQKSASELKQQVSVLKLNAGEMSESDKKEFENKINVYLKEIDRCIALLGE